MMEPMASAAKGKDPMLRESRKSRRYAFWLVALLAVFLQYQVIDIMIEVSSLRSSNLIPASSRTTGYRS